MDEFLYPSSSFFTSSAISIERRALALASDARGLSVFGPNPRARISGNAEAGLGVRATKAAKVRRNTTAAFIQALAKNSQGNGHGRQRLAASGGSPSVNIAKHDLTREQEV
jgi:hypothetical protein